MTEAYKDPTAQKAIGNITKIEQLRRKHNIREGDVIDFALEIREEPGGDKCVKKKIKVRIKEIHTHLITLILPNGLLESFTWWEFEQRRR